MDEEHERQRRDLQRATMLLEAMPREDMFEMLLDILSNERSNDTRKLSDWMAFQIILHDGTRHERELLAQLGKNGRNHRRSQASQMLHATRRSPEPSQEAFQIQDDDPEGDSSSTASFATCAEAEPVKAIQAKENIAVGGATAEVQAISGILADATETQVDDKHDSGDNLALSKSEEENLGRVENKPTSWVRRWCDTILRRRPPARSGPNTSRVEPHQPEVSVALVSSRPQIVTSHSDVTPTVHHQGSSRSRQSPTEIKFSSVTSGVGNKNLADLYARYDKVREERRNVYHGSEDNEANTHDLDVSKSCQARDNSESTKCYYCRLYFTSEQNVRDLDNGSSPCSYHPGRAAWISEGTGRPFWTCCRREIPWDDFLSNPEKAPGCTEGYHESVKEFRCCFCGQLFTEERNGFQLDGSPPCSYHPGSAVPDARVGEVWTCCKGTAHSKGLRWDSRWDSRTPGCTGLYHISEDEAFHMKERNLGLPLFP